MMRLSNEEFAAEVLRRSAEKKRAGRIRIKHICMTAGAAAACLAVAVGISVRSSMKNHTAIVSDNAGHYSMKNEDTPAYEAEQAFRTPENAGADKAESKSEPSAGEQSAQTVLSAEKTVWELSESPEITVLFSNEREDALTLTVQDFILTQDGQQFTFPAEADTETVSVQPHETASLRLPAADAVGDLRGTFRLIYAPDGAELTLTLK